jgi:hypothetical protein
MTSQKIIAVLGKAGFTKSTSSTTSVRGWYNITKGFEVREEADTEYGAHSYNHKMYIRSKTINGWIVCFTNGTTIMGAVKEAEKINALVQRYLEALQAAGIECLLRQDNYHTFVWVPMQDKIAPVKAEKSATSDNTDSVELRARVYHKLHAAGYAKQVKIEVTSGGLWITAREASEAESVLRDVYGVLNASSKYAASYADARQALLVAAM